jgi:Putative zinc-finger
VEHGELRALLPSYAAGELDLAEAAAVQEHLATGCRTCLEDVFSRPVGLPRTPPPPPAPAIPVPVPVSALEVPAPRRRPGVAVVAVLAGLVLVAVWQVVDLRGRAAARGRALERERVRAAALEAERVRLSSRLTSASQALAAARDAAERRAMLDAVVSEAPPSEAPAPPPAEIGESESAPAPLPGVRYRDDLLSVHVTAMSADVLVAEIGRQSGATIRGRPVDREVSAEFDDVPLPEALHRLLGGQNFWLAYDDRRRLRTVELLGGPEGSLDEVASSVRPAPPRPPVPTPEAAAILLDGAPPIALAGPLAREFRTPTVSLRQLIDVALHHGDETVRAEAARTTLAAVEADPSLAALLDGLAGMDETALARLVRRLAGDRAEEALTEVAAGAHRGDVRSKATTVLERLRSGGQGADG